VSCADPRCSRIVREAEVRLGGSGPGRSLLPKRGVYFFLEPGEFRVANPNLPRVVRVGTHAVSAGSKSTLRGRLKQHLGTQAGGGRWCGGLFHERQPLGSCAC
jgi:hypothetical protein